MPYRNAVPDVRLSLSALLACLAFVACDVRHEQTAATPDPVEEDDAEIGPANSCRVPPQSCSDSQKCCPGNVCLNDDLTPDPDDGPLSCRPCGKPDQLCCGTKRATSLKALAKRCNAKGFVCPQTESADICEPCGEAYQHCCLDKNGKTKCEDGTRCIRTVPGGGGREASPGMCLPEEN